MIAARLSSADIWLLMNPYCLVHLLLRLSLTSLLVFTCVTVMMKLMHLLRGEPGGDGDESDPDDVGDCKYGDERGNGVAQPLHNAQPGFRRGDRERKPASEWWKAGACAAVVSDEPVTVQQALSSDAAEMGKLAMDKEIVSLLA
jgi:hypothetical protein